MTTTLKRLIIVQPQLFLAECLVKLFQGKRIFKEIFLASGGETALELGARVTEHVDVRELYYLVGGISYFKMAPLVQQLTFCFPKAKIIFLDERPRHGCGFMVDRMAVHGCLTLHDSQSDFLHCLATVAKGKAALAPSVQPILTFNSLNDALECRPELRETNPHLFTEKEWLCFEHLVSGQELKTLASKLNLEIRSTKNLKYRMMQKLNVSRFSDVLRLAQNWGFVE